MVFAGFLSKRSFNLTVVFLVAILTFGVAKASYLSSARISNFLNHGHYEEAYRFAKSISYQESGDTVYDMLLGKAALAVGKNDEAVLAFERVVINDPSNATARFLLAEAYYKIKSYDEAREELNLIPKAEKEFLNTKIFDLEKKIKRGIAWRDKTYTYYGRLNFGYDNNVNVNTDGDYVKYLDLINFDISAYGEDLASDLYNRLRQFNYKKKSIYIYPQVGVRGSNNLNNKLQFVWDINASHKEYLEVNKFDATQINIIAGLNYKFIPKYIFSSNLYYQEYLLNMRRNREAPIVSFSLSREMNKNNILKIYTNDGILAYPHSRTSDVMMYSGGLEWDYFDNKNIIVAQVYCGENQPRGIGVAYNANNFYGSEVTIKRQLIPKVQLIVSGAFQRSLYDVKQFVHSQPRKDSYRNFVTGVYYELSPNYVYYVLGSYTNNSSNIFLYRYDRLEFWTGFSFRF